MVTTAKPVLVFVPGLGATGEAYEPLLRRLRSDYDVRVAMHSLELPERLDWPFFLRAVDQAADGVDRFTLLGHSMGGATVLAYAARHPERAVRAAAVAPLVTTARKLGRPGLARFRLWRRLKNLALALRSGHPGHALRTARISARILAEGRRQRLYDWANSIDLGTDLEKLHTARVLWPKREEVLFGDHLLLLRQYPNVPVTIIPGGHNNLALNPRSIYAYVRRALDG